MQEKDITLSSRKKEILLSSIESFIANGQPVSSGSLQDTHKINLSSAGIRNELAALEELGFLKKLHTSGGRVPTTRGYQAYIAGLSQNIPRDAKILDEIKKTFMQRTGTLSKLLSDVAKTVSQVTHYPTVVLMDGLKNFVVKKIQIVPLLSNQAMALIETNAGMIDPIIIEAKNLTPESCLDASMCLTNNFKEKRISDLIEMVNDATRRMQDDLKHYAEIFEKVVRLLKNYIAGKESEIISAGAKNVLSLPEYQNAVKAKDILEFIEDKERLQAAFDEEYDSAEKIKYKLGIQTGEGKDDKAAMVETSCVVGGITLAKLAVIGPERMNYEKIASALKFITAEFDNINKEDL